jgi:hypothetical protein
MRDFENNADPKGLKQSAIEAPKRESNRGFRDSIETKDKATKEQIINKVSSHALYHSVLCTHYGHFLPYSAYGKILS